MALAPPAEPRDSRDGDRRRPVGGVEIEFLCHGHGVGTGRAAKTDQRERQQLLIVKLGSESAQPIGCGAAHFDRC